MKVGDIVQVCWYQGPSGLRSCVSYPDFVRKGVLWTGETPVPALDAEWECRVVRDARPDRAHEGELTLAFIAAHEVGWAYWATSPKIYGEQRVRPMYAVGRRVINYRARPPADVVAEESRLNAAYDAVLPKAVQALRTLLDGHDQKRLVEELPVDLPGLSGRLRTCIKDDECSRVFSTSRANQLVKAWSFLSNESSDGLLRESIRLDVVLAPGFDSFMGCLIVVDWKAAVDALGEPWVEAKDVPRGFTAMWEFGPQLIRASIGASALPVVRQCPFFGELIVSTEREWANADAQRKVREHADAQRAAAREQALAARTATVRGMPEGPATLDTLKARFAKR